VDSTAGSGMLQSGADNMRVNLPVASARGVSAARRATGGAGTAHALVCAKVGSHACRGSLDEVLGPAASVPIVTTMEKPAAMGSA
jgi:hypothetical protein